MRRSEGCRAARARALSCSRQRLVRGAGMVASRSVAEAGWRLSALTYGDRAVFPDREAMTVFDLASLTERPWLDEPAPRAP